MSQPHLPGPQHSVFTQSSGVKRTFIFTVTWQVTWAGSVTALGGVSLLLYKGSLDPNPEPLRVPGGTCDLTFLDLTIAEDSLCAAFEESLPWLCPLAVPGVVINAQLQLVEGDQIHPTADLVPFYQLQQSIRFLIHWEERLQEEGGSAGPLSCPRLSLL